MITAKEEEVAVLKRWIVELEAEGVRGRSEAPSPGARPPRLSGRPSSEVVESTLPAIAGRQRRGKAKPWQLKISITPFRRMVKRSPTSSAVLRRHTRSPMA